MAWSTIEARRASSHQRKSSSTVLIHITVHKKIKDHRSKTSSSVSNFKSIWLKNMADWRRCQAKANRQRELVEVTQRRRREASLLD